MPCLEECVVHLGNAVERAAERARRDVVAQVEIAPQPDRVSAFGFGFGDVGGAENLRGVEHRPGSAGIEARLPGRVQAVAQLSSVGAGQFALSHLVVIPVPL